MWMFEADEEDMERGPSSGDECRKAGTNNATQVDSRGKDAGQCLLYQGHAGEQDTSRKGKETVKRTLVLCTAETGSLVRKAVIQKNR